MLKGDKKTAVFMKELPKAVFLKGMTLMTTARPSVEQVASFMPAIRQRHPFWWWLLPFSYVTRLEYDCATASALAANLSFSFANIDETDKEESENEHAQATKH